MEKPSSESATTPVSAATALPIPAWEQLPSGLTDPCSLSWLTSAPMEALGWAAQQQDWGAVFNKPDDWPNSKADKFGMGDDNW